MKNNLENKEGGFIKLIIFIVIAIFLLKHFEVSLSDVIDWIKSVI